MIYTTNFNVDIDLFSISKLHCDLIFPYDFLRHIGYLGYLFPGSLYLPTYLKISRQKTYYNVEQFPNEALYCDVTTPSLNNLIYNPPYYPPPDPP